MRETLRYDHYRVLGVQRNASRDQIKKAYRGLAKRCHPDRNPEPHAKTLFLTVQLAYEELIDPDKRRRYDERLQHYRPTTNSTVRPRPPHTYRSAPDRPVNRLAFIGLHVTGLCFGVALITGVLLGVTFFEWPAFTLLFCLPGIAVIPDSLAGLRVK